MYYSVLVEFWEGIGKNKKLHSVTMTDQPNTDRIKLEIINPYVNNSSILIDGYFLNKDDIARIKIVSTEHSIKSLVDAENRQLDIDNRNAGIIMFSSYNSIDIINHKELVCDVTSDVLREVQQKLTNLKTSQKKSNQATFDNKKVFIVHGHDDKIKLDVSNFLRKLGAVGKLKVNN